MGKARGGVLAVISLALTGLFYGHALRFDLQCDDLLMIRPWSRAELFAVWHGTWEPSHAFATFFRPVATWFYAGTFELFGWHATAHMLLSIAMLAAVTWLLAMFIARETGRATDGLYAVVIYLLHPNTPWSTGVWVTNDFHKLTAIFALSGLLAWQRLRHRAPARWWLLAPFAVICFLIKEDGLMLIPVFVSLQWARARLVGDVKSPGLPVVMTAAVVGAALVAWRYLALRELGGFGIPASAYAIAHNLTRGPLYAFTMHGSLSVLTPLEKLAAIAAVGVVAAGLALMSRPQRFLPIAGLILMFWYGLPLALISNVMRYYMLTIASVIVIVPVFLALHTAGAQERRWPVYLGGLVLLFFVVQARGEFGELKLFAPCQRLDHECVPWVLDEVATLPPEARAYTADTERACAVNPDTRPRIGDAGVLTWGLGTTSVDTMTGDRSSAVTGDVVVLIRNAARASVSVRHSEASAMHPVKVGITADGHRSTHELTTPEWTRIDVALTDGLRSWLRGAHRVDATFSMPGAEWKLIGEPQKQRP